MERPTSEFQRWVADFAFSRIRKPVNAVKWLEGEGSGLGGSVSTNATSRPMKPGAWFLLVQ